MLNYSTLCRLEANEAPYSYRRDVIIHAGQSYKYVQQHFVQVEACLEDLFGRPFRRELHWYIYWRCAKCMD